MFNKKFNARDTVSAGTIIDLYDFDLVNERLVPGDERTLRNTQGSSLLTQVYAQWQHRFSDRLTLKSGVNYQHFEVSGAQAIGPRAGLECELSKKQMIGIGYGRHSQMQPLESYFIQARLADGSMLETNKELEFTHSHHYVLSYNNQLGSDLSMKVETYYQDISNAPIQRTPGSFSMLNAGADFTPVDETFLVNGGEGRNYGLELTLEKFYSQGYYFLLTTSLFSSEYKSSDGIWRSTAFNGGYVANLLGGKEFKIGKKQHTLNIDMKLTASGGNRVTPVDFERSAELGYQVLREGEAFTEQLGDYLRADLKISYRINKPKLTHEFGVDLQNITNNANEFARTYNARTNTVQTQYQIGFFPVPQYRLLF